MTTETPKQRQEAQAKPYLDRIMFIRRKVIQRFSEPGKSGPVIVSTKALSTLLSYKPNRRFCIPLTVLYDVLLPKLAAQRLVQKVHLRGKPPKKGRQPVLWGFAYFGELDADLAALHDRAKQIQTEITRLKAVGGELAVKDPDGEQRMTTTAAYYETLALSGELRVLSAEINARRLIGEPLRQAPSAVTPSCEN